MKRLSPFAWVELAILVATILFGAAAIAHGQAGSVSLNTGTCLQTVNNLNGGADAYSGPFAIFGTQYGVITADVGAGNVQLRLGLGRTEQGSTCAPALLYAGDCYQSVTTIRATAGAPKWIVAMGTPPNCYGPGISIWKYLSGAFQYQGSVKVLAIVPSVGAAPRGVDRGGDLRLVGDTAYVPLTIGIPTHTYYVQCELNMKACAPTALNDAPTADPTQTNALGFAYSISMMGGNAAHLMIAQTGSVQPTAPVPPTTPTLVRTAAKTPTQRPSGGATCCDPPNCPAGAPIPPCHTATPARARTATRSPLPPTPWPTLPAMASSTPVPPPTVTAFVKALTAAAPSITPTPAPSCWFCGCKSK